MKSYSKKCKINENKVQCRKSYISKETFTDQSQNFRGKQVGKYCCKLRMSVRK
jgi:hypothetical protein